MVPELRARGVGEMLDTAALLYRTRFGALVRVSAAVVIPMQVISTLVLLSAQPDSFGVGLTGTPTARFTAARLGVRVGAGAVLLILPVLASAFVSAVTTRVIADAYVEREDTLGEQLKVARSRYLAVLGAAVLSTLVIAMGMVACLLPGLWLQAAFAVAIPALILEGIGVFASFGRSFKLTQKYWWLSFRLIWSAVLLTAVLGAGLTLALNVLVRDYGPTTLVIVQGVASAISSTITLPFTAAAAVVLYFDLRTRAEAFDMQLLLGRLDARRAAAPAGPTDHVGR